MGTKIMKLKETETVFDRRNYVILLIGSVMIIVGYLFMSGEGSTPAYNPDIFSGLRIRVAPIVCLTGYLINIFGILYRPKRS